MKAQETKEGSEHRRAKLENLVWKTMVISRGLTLAGNSTNVRKNYSKYSLPNAPVDQYVMNVGAEKKPRFTSAQVMFMDEDEAGVNYPHDDAVVIILEIDSTKVNRVLMDTSSSASIIFKEMLDSPKIKNLKIGPTNTTLYGFVDSYILSFGSV